jgi:amidase
MTMHDPYNAFCRHTHVALDGAAAGPLRGLTFAAKDVFDVAGHRTGNGNPVWLETHPPAARTAAVIDRLLAAGADMVGKTHTDELTYSINGENVHYGTPVNPRAPGRIPGGSSSGSAAAVAGGLVDFALGTDCGGSVRIPASYCGIYGIRTTHGLVPVDGVIDLAASFDTVGWFARDPAMMRRVGDVLLPAAPDFVPQRLLIAADAFAFVGAETAAALAPAVTRLKALFPDHRDIAVYTDDPAAWSSIFRILQGDEIRRRHGAGSMHTSRTSVPASPNASAGRGRSRPPRSNACDRCARTSPAA